MPLGSSSCTVKHTTRTRGADEPNETSRPPRQLEQRAGGRRQPSRTGVARRYRRYANPPGRPSRQRPIPPTRHEVRPGVIAPHHAGAARTVRDEGGKGMHHTGLHDRRPSGNDRVERARPKIAKLITRPKGPLRSVLVSSRRKLRAFTSSSPKKLNGVRQLRQGWSSDEKGRRAGRMERGGTEFNQSTPARLRPHPSSVTDTPGAR